VSRPATKKARAEASRRAKARGRSKREALLERRALRLHLCMDCVRTVGVLPSERQNKTHGFSHPTLCINWRRLRCNGNVPGARHWGSRPYAKWAPEVR
jgi:hypothetical protein